MDEDPKVKISPDSRGGVEVPREELRENLRRNTKASFEFEGVKLSPMQEESLEKIRKHRKPIR